MVKCFLKAEFCGLVPRLVLGLAVAVTQLCLPAPAAGEGLFLHHHKAKAEDAPPPPKPFVQASQPAAFSIAVEPLGFSPPGAYYQGQRQSMVSLDFLDESRLLFTFHAPGLIHRSAGTQYEESHTRALVLTLPQGGVEAEALWTLHDHDRYLWMLRDGHFLLRDLNDLKEGGADLELKPLLRFPGPLLWLGMDPEQQFLVTDSDEPVRSASKTGTADQSDSTGVADPDAERDVVLRILRRASGKVMLVTRAHNVMHLPINSDGYLETLRSKDMNFTLNLNYFSGGSRILGGLDSACVPAIQFLSQKVALANTCTRDGGRLLVAFSTEGGRMWDALAKPEQVWPLLVLAPNGSRVARETLVVTHPVDAFSPLSFDDVRGQLVEVFDAASGKLVLKVPASPVLDGGGNVAISPSGRRVAVLDGGSIQVYELPAPPLSAQPDRGQRAR